jgi:hypothetical protein
MRRERDRERRESYRLRALQRVGSVALTEQRIQRTGYRLPEGGREGAVREQQNLGGETSMCSRAKVWSDAVMNPWGKKKTGKGKAAGCPFTTQESINLTR